MEDARQVNLFNVQLKERIYPETITDAQKEVLFNFGREYYDDTSFPGFGGYEYDGSWSDVAGDIFDYFNLPDDAEILDVGCAKGFLLYDFKKAKPNCRVHGVDISAYAIENAIPQVRSNLICAGCTKLPFEDSSFDLVTCLDTLHNLTESDCRQAVREISRVGRRHQFVMVHSYHDEVQRNNLIRWEATIRLVLSVDEWKRLFAQEGYEGLYYWKIFT